MSNNIQILNYNHNVISLSNGNTIIITDNVKGNSISIPQPVTSILQINSPGPQGPAGANGSSINTGSLLTTASFNSYTSSVTSQFAGTSSYATTSSFALNGGGTTINTSSFVTTSSFNSYTQSINTATSSFVTNSQTSSFVLNSQTSSMTVRTSITSSYPITVDSSFNLISTNPAAGTGAVGGNGSNIFFGVQAGAGVITVSYSNFFGLGAGYQATDASESNFLGYQAGFQSINASNSNFLGATAGFSASYANCSNFFGPFAGNLAKNASYSNLFGLKAGSNGNNNVGIGSNNIVIGTNISLENNRRDSINIGAIIFGTGSYSTVTAGNECAFTGSANGKIGINQPNPSFNFEVSGSVGFKNLTNSAQANVVGIDVATGKLYYQGPGEFASGSFATTGSNTFNGNQTISGSLLTSGSNTFNGNQTISGSLNVSGSISTNYVYIDTYISQSYFLINNPACVYRFSNTTGQTVSVNIPDASTYPGRIYYISRPAESDADVIILNSASNIENDQGGFNTSVTLGPNEKYQWISDGTSWILITTNKTK
jgi:hypothetical protein